MSATLTTTITDVKPPMRSSASKPKASLLELILEADPLPHNADPAFHPLTGERQIPIHLLQGDYHLSPPLKPMGHVSLDVLQEMIAFEEYRHFPVFAFYPRLSPREIVPGAIKYVSFDLELVKKGKEALGLGMEALVWFMRARGSMKKRVYDREDIFSMYADPRSLAFADRRGGMEPWGNIGLTVYRPPTAYFGTPWVGVSMIVYEGEGEDMKLWIQKRSDHVHYPGQLDTTAAGAVETERTAWEGMSKEAEEEANLSDEIVRKYGSFAGDLTFFLDPNTAPKPLVHLCFDLKRPDPSAADYAATQPIICDGEVTGFVLMTIPEIHQALQDRKFQPSAIPDLIFFMVRKGLITHENEPELDEIMARCQRKHDVAFPHRLLDFDSKC